MIISRLFGEYLKQSEVNHLIEANFIKNAIFSLVELLDLLQSNPKGSTSVLCMYSCLREAESVNGQK